jgi:hypothetical protein
MMGTTRGVVESRAISAVLVLAGAVMLPIIPASASVPENIVFEVLRDGDSSIGRHTVSFRPRGDELRVEIEIELEVTLAFITVFRYEHHNVEIWRDSRLIALDARTNDDGKRAWVKAHQTSQGLAVTGSSGSFIAPADTMPTNYWNKAMIERTRLLDTLSGRMVEVSVEPVGSATVDWGGRAVNARKYVARGDLDLTIWYTPDGEWVKLAFKARGSDIEYLRRDSRRHDGSNSGDTAQ